ncbi:MAG: YybS family protein [Bdellovibrionales bacterium]|nr:YybS family protein [Bdellovibrionales bacterium]
MTKTAETPYFDQNATVAKLMFLAIITISLCSFGMGLFAPIPLAIAFLLYGRVVTFAVAGISLALLIAAAKAVQGFPMLTAGMYLSALLYAVLVSEVIFRNVNPVKGLIVSGLILVVLSAGSLIAFDRMSPTTLKGEISQSVSSVLGQLKKQKQDSSEVTGEQERAFDDFVSKPEVLTNDIYTSLPWIVFIVCYFGLWISLYVTLRNSLVWRYKVLYNYGLKDLTHFKVPDFFVYPLIASLVLILGADYGLPAWSEVVGSNLLYCLGVFYLFQGFGVYNDFLKFLKIGGFIKTLFIAFTFILAPKLLAGIGIFDLWFDFRRFFTKTKKDEGDTI